MTKTTRALLRLVPALVLAVGMGAVEASPASAQYFGRNTVQYRTFDFQILRTTHFDIYFYPEFEESARDAGRMAERWYARLSRVLDHEFESRQPLVLYASHPDFQQTTTTMGELGEGTQGFTDVFKQRIVMPLGNSYEGTDRLIGHELVHAFQFDISGLGRAGGGLEEAFRRYNVPLWFTEGMAEYLSIGPVDPHTAMWLRDAALTGRIPTLEQLTYDPQFFPYRWGQAFWAYVGGRWGDAVLGQILKQVGQGVPFPDAFQRILNTSLDDIIDDWGTSIRRAYLPLLADRREAREEARPLITRREGGGRYNVAPVVSPDGRWVALLSELRNLDVELWVANAETGEIDRRLVRGTAFDPHFGSLRFINSAGTWSPDSRSFAFAALRGGRDVVVTVDAQRGRIQREYAVPGVREITNPTWSPDGRTIVFSGHQNGVTDLYALDLQNGQARRLMQDRFADLHPSFSPDGRTVAFVTDRGTTDFETLSYGAYRLATMDWESGEITLLPAFGEKSINPVWSRDGAGVYFISNRSGIANVYRLDVQTQAVTQVTNLFTGVSGITDLSPAISSAWNTDRLVFAAYERGAYNVYSMSNPAELAGTPPAEVQLAGTAPLPALLPPIPRPDEAPFNRVLALVNDDAVGLPPLGEEAEWPVSPYRPRISLDYLGQPAVGVAVSTGGFDRGGLYGGISGIFSDMLGHHTIGGTVQAQGQFDEVGFSVMYLNRRNRWNYGAATQRIPYMSGGYRNLLEPDGLLRQQLVIYRQFDLSLTGLAQYPFSRVRRAEISGGVRRISQDFQIREYLYEPIFQDGALVGHRGPFDYQERREGLPNFNMAEASAALVYDNSLFSFTSPFAGQRYRFQISPTFGDLQFTQGLADYRRYLYVRPFTLAVRGYHYGRYGRDEGRLGAIYLGYPFLVRGYGWGDVQNACGNEQRAGGAGEECRVFNELRGPRLAVANAELRFPLIRQVVVGGGLGLPPIEGFGFFDAGTAYGVTEVAEGQSLRVRPTWQRGISDSPREHGVFTSAGVGARVNLFGYFIVEGAYVNPLDRPRGWHWQFALQPGF